MSPLFSAATQLQLKVLADLDSLSPSVQLSIAADLVAAFSDARAELRVSLLACKFHNVCVPDQPFMDHLLVVLDHSSSWPCRLLHACLVQDALQAPPCSAEGTNATQHHHHGHSHHHSHNTDGGYMHLLL